MGNRLPHLLSGHKICIICEGNEEFFYLDRLKSLGVWKPIYDIHLVNAEGNGNIPARYQDRYQNGDYEMVFVFCDTERKPHEQYRDIKRKIDAFHGVEAVSDEIVIFGNPCTMQIVIKHWLDVRLSSPAKRRNTGLIKDATGLEDYKAKAEQITELMKHINADNYEIMSERVKLLDCRDTVLGSSNFSKLISNLSNPDAGWIREINSRLEG